MFTLEIAIFLCERMRYRSFLRQFVRRTSYVQGQSISPRTREYFYYIDHQGQLFLDDIRVKNFITCFKDKKFLNFFFKRVKVNTSGRYESEFPYVSPCSRETNYIRCDDLPVVFSQLLDSQEQVIQDIASFGSSLPDHNPPNYHGGYPPNETSESVRSEGKPFTPGENSGVYTFSTIQTEETRPLMDLQSTTATNGSVGSESGLYSPLSTPLRLAYGGTLSLTVPFQPSSLCMLPASGRVYHSGLEKLGGVGLIKSSLAIELSRFFVYGEEEGREEEGAREGANPVGFRWQGRTWLLDSALMLPRVAQFTNAQT